MLVDRRSPHGRGRRRRSLVIQKSPEGCARRSPFSIWQGASSRRKEEKEEEEEEEKKEKVKKEETTGRKSNDPNTGVGE